MKTVFVNRFFHPDQSATSQILSDLAFRLSAKGREVWVVASRQTYDDPRADLPAREYARGVRVIRVRSTRFGRAGLPGRVLDSLSFSFGCLWALLTSLKRADTLVVETDPPLICVFALAAARIRGARLINWIQDLFPEVAVALGVRGVSGPVRATLEALRDASLRAAFANVAISQQMAAKVAQRVADARRVEVIHNWSDGKAIRPVPHEINPLRKEWGLDRRFVVGYSGNLGRAHEFEAVLEAASLVTDPSICFLWIGAGKRLGEFQERLRARGLTGRFHFKPHQAFDRLAFSLSAADAHLVTLKPALEGLVVPSKFYGILAAGRAVIYVGDPRGDLAKIVSAQGCGQAVAPDRARDLADCLSDWAARPERCRLMGRSARELYETCFDEEMAVSRWERLLGGE